MSQKFQASIQHRDDIGYVKLTGVIDEDNELADLTDKIPGSTVVIELGEVERINSCGVRDWVNWLSALEAKGASIILIKCSPAIVAQINLVNNFMGNGAVKSFYVPYFCPECDEEKVLLSETSEMGPPPHEPPVCRCDGCDLVMDFDDMPDSYFAFLANQKKIAQTDKVHSILEEFGSAVSEPAKRVSRAGSLSGTISHTSLPSVPSLPSITGGQTGVGTNPGALYSTQEFGGNTPALAGPGTGAIAASAVQSREAPNNGLIVYVLIGVLVLAIAILAYLILTT